MQQSQDPFYFKHKTYRNCVKLQFANINFKRDGIIETYRVVNCVIFSRYNTEPGARLKFIFQNRNLLEIRSRIFGSKPITYCRRFTLWEVHTKKCNKNMNDFWWSLTNNNWKSFYVRALSVSAEFRREEYRKVEM